MTSHTEIQSFIPEYDIWGHRKQIDVIGLELRYLRNKNPRILDIGCGTGVKITLPLAEMGFNITGIDIDEESISLANEINRFPNARFIAMDFLESTIKEKFDVIIISQVIEHLEHPEAMLEKAGDLLGDNGIMIIGIPNGNGSFEIECRLKKYVDVMGISKKIYDQKCNLKKKLLNRSPTPDPLVSLADTCNETPHVQFLSVGKAKQLFERCGLRTIRVYGGPIMHTQIFSALFGDFGVAIYANHRLADILPKDMAGSFLFVVQRDMIIDYINKAIEEKRSVGN